MAKIYARLIKKGVQVVIPPELKDEVERILREDLV